MKPPLSFVTLLSFDFKYAFAAISSYYAIADEIILGLDQDHLSWSATPFDIDMVEVRKFIDRIDVDRKIRVVQGSFHSSRNPMQNDTQERNALSHHCKAGSWVVQIDSDEILVNAEEFVTWISEAGNSLDDAQLAARWITVFKRFGDQALVIHPVAEATPFATRSRGEYFYSRHTHQREAMSPLKLLHISWGRSPEELMKKLRNWSHSKDFDTEAFFKKWESLTMENYHEWTDFHPLIPHQWQKLVLVDRVQDVL